MPHDAVLLLEEFQPPPSLKVLMISGYQGGRLPSWIEDDLGSKLPELVRLTLDSFKRCCFLSSRLYQLPYLKHLILSKLPELRVWSRVSLEEDDVINEVRSHGGEDESSKATFPCLEILEIYECPQLISIPFTPRLQKLIGEDINVGLWAGEEASTGFPYLTELNLTLVHGLCSLVVNCMPSLKELKIKNCRQLTNVTVESTTTIKSLSIEKCELFRKIHGLHHLSSCLEDLLIEECEEMNELPRKIDRLMSLESLEIWRLPKITSLPRSIGKLVALAILNICYLPELTSLPDSFDRLTQLRHLQIGYCPKMSSYIESTSFCNLLCRFTLLEMLRLGGFPNLKALPKSIQHLSHLRELAFIDLPKLRLLPIWFTKLTSLRTLEIIGCPRLEERCKEPNGQNWPLIRHIPNLTFNSTHS